MSNIILVVDIETTGFLNQGGLIVEIGIVKLDLDTGKIIPVYSSLIREDGFNILHTKGNFGWIFKNSDITFELVQNAPSLESQKATLQKLFDQYAVTAYNKEFDFGFLKSRGFILQELPCLMVLASSLMNLQFEYGLNNPKWPKLKEVWLFFFGDTGYLETHRSLDDAKHEAVIAHEMYKKGLFKNKTSACIEIDYYTHLAQSAEVLSPELLNSYFNGLTFYDERLELIPSFNETSWGYIDQNSNIIIPFQFDWADNFKSGIARIIKKGYWGTIDLNGKVIIPIIYDWINPFSTGIAICCLKGVHKIINECGKHISDIYAPPWGYYDNYGEFHSGLAWVESYLNPRDPNAPYDHSYFGFINIKGKPVTDLKYHKVNSFSQGLACVRMEKFWGYINELDKEIIPFIFDEAYSFSDGIAFVRKNHKSGYIDFNGKEVIPIIYDELHQFTKGLAYYAILGDKKERGFLNKHGARVISWYDNFVEFKGFSEGLASIAKNVNGLLKWGYINEYGKIMIDCKFTTIESFSNGIAKVELNGKYGFINKEGKEIIPFSYDEAESFKDGFAKVKINKKWGLIGKKGNHVTPLIYDEIKDFSEGLAVVQINGLMGCINQKGEQTIPIEYQEIGNFKYSTAFIQKDNKFGHINRVGKEFFPLYN